MKTNTTILLGGGALVAVLLMSGKKKTTTSTTPTIPTPIPIPQDVPLEEASEDEKKYLDFYYTVGLYKIQDLNVIKFAGPPELSKKGDKSDATWLTDISYWNMYSVPGNEHNTNAPWDVTSLDHTNEWFKVWQRMYGYAQKLIGKA